MKYAVISIGSKQYRVSEGDVIEVQQLPVKAQDSYTFSDILLYVDENEKKIGVPTLSDVMVTGGVLENARGEKIRVAKFKAKSRYRKVMGFRPAITKIKIEKISLKGKEKATK